MCVLIPFQQSAQHLAGEAITSFSEMSCDACMKSHDFLSAYKLQTNPVTLVKEDNDAEVSVADTPPSGAPPAAGGSVVAGSGKSVCELARRRRLLGDCVDSKRTAGFFEENWRSTLCTCSDCKVSTVHIDYLIGYSTSCINYITYIHVMCTCMYMYM